LHKREIFAMKKIKALIPPLRQTIYFSNSVVTPNNKYEYDALYRLTTATGREHPGQGAHSHDDYPINDLPHPNNTDQLINYTEEYTYDEVGNITQVAHKASNNNWTRNYDYNFSENYLTGFNGSTDFTYDNHGNIASMPHLNTMIWDYADNLRKVDLGGG